MKKLQNNQIIIPLLPLRDIVVFPGMITPLFVGRSKSIAALEEVMSKSRFIFVVASVTETNEGMINSEKLVIPHPQIKERKFVLKPWSDIDSCYILATSNKKISELLNETLDNSELLIIKK